jgi:hypothetical protein
MLALFFQLSYELFDMKKDKDKKEKDLAKKAPSQLNKEDLPVKNATTDTVKNTASETPGLNQENTTRDDLFPSDGDNLTN